MGTYVYTARTKSITATVELDHSTYQVEISHVVYAARISDWDGDYYHGADYSRALARRAKRREHAANAAAQSDLFVICGGTKDRPFEGAMVFQASDWNGVWYDSNRLPGKLIGYLRKSGRRWVVRNNTGWGVAHLEASSERASHQWTLIEDRLRVDREGNSTRDVRPAYVSPSQVVGTMVTSLHGDKVGYFAGFTPDGYAIICRSRDEQAFEAAMAAAGASA